MGENRGFGYSLKNIFFRPNLAFNNLKAGTAIIFAVILIFSASIFNGVVQGKVSKVPNFEEEGLTDEMIKELKDAGYSDEKIEDMKKNLNSKEYKEIMKAIGKFSGVFTLVGAFFSGIGTAIGWLIKAGILTLIFSFMGANPKFGESMGIIGLAWIPFFLREIIRGISTLTTGKGFKLASSMINNLDIFVLWNVILLIIGFSVCYRVSKKRAGAVVIGYWALTMLYYYGIDSLGKLILGGIGK